MNTTDLNQIHQILTEKQTALASLYQQVMRDHIFSARTILRPKMIPTLAQAEAEAFLQFLAEPKEKFAQERGKTSYLKGLSEQTLIALNKATRAFVLEHLPPELQTIGVETAESYHTHALTGFIHALHHDVLKEQERMRTALEQAIARQTEQLKAAAEIGKATTSILDLDELLKTAADRIQAQMGYYYVGIYLVDNYNQYAFQRYGTGTAGKALRQEGFKIPLKQNSIIAWAIRNGEPRIVPDVTQDPEYLFVDHLPDTRSEIALPLKGREGTLGALNIQSTQINAFTEQQVITLQIIADQLANAIANARLFAQAQTSLEELQALQRQQFQAGDNRDQLAYIYEQSSDTFKPATDWWRPELDTAVTQKTPVKITNPHDKEAKSALAVPITLRGEIIGVIDLLDVSQARDWTENDIALTTAVVSQAALSINNAELFQRTQAALDEAQRRTQELSLINHVVSTISASTNLQESMQFIARELAHAVGVRQIGIALMDETRTNLVVVGEYYDKRISTSALGFVIPIEGNEPTQEVIRTKKPLIILDAPNDPRLAPISEGLRGRGVHTLIIFPMVSGDEVIGTVGIDLLKGEQMLTPEQMRLTETIIFQAATAAQNARLFEQLQTEAERLNKLAQIEANLSQATDEVEILESVVAHLENIPSATLYYLEKDKNEQPAYINSVAHWNGRYTTLARQTYELANFPLNHIWLNHPRQVLYITDINKDGRVNPTDKKQLKKDNIAALAIIPLHTRRQWEGILTLTWPEPHQFSVTEQFIFRRLLESLSAIVASRRAALSQEKALALTSTLYQASSDLNSARTFDEILSVLRKHTILGRGAQNISLNYFDRPWTNEDMPDWVEVIARWTELPPETFMERYPLKAFPSAPSLVHPDKPTVIEDIENDPRLDDNVRALYAERFGAKSTIFVPFIIGTNWVGWINAIYQQPTKFSDDDVTLLMSLARQAAVTVENIRLLEQTQELLEKERRQHELAETLLRVSQRMAETLSEAEVRDVLIDEINKTLYPDQISFYEWIESEQAFRLLSKTLAAPDHAEDAYEIGQLITPEERPDLWQVFRETNSLLEHTPVHGEFLREHYCLPWYVGVTPAGVIEIYHTARHLSIRPEDQARCEGIVSQGALAIQNARSFAEVQKRAQQEARLRQVTTEVRNAVDVETVLKRAAAEIGRVLQRRTFIYLNPEKPAQSSEKTEKIQVPEKKEA